MNMNKDSTEKDHETESKDNKTIEEPKTEQGKGQGKETSNKDNQSSKKRNQQHSPEEVKQMKKKSTENVKYTFTPKDGHNEIPNGWSPTTSIANNSSNSLESSDSSESEETSEDPSEGASNQSWQTEDKEDKAQSTQEDRFKVHEGYMPGKTSGMRDHEDQEGNNSPETMEDSDMDNYNDDLEEALTEGTTRRGEEEKDTMHGTQVTPIDDAKEQKRSEAETHQSTNQEQENSEDQSTATENQNNTKSNKGAQIDNNLSDSEDSMERTINLGKTSRYQTREEENTIVEPINTRFQFVFSLKAPEVEEILNTVSTTEQDTNERVNKSKENISRIREVLKELYDTTRNIDPDARFLRWTDKKNFKTIGKPEDELPEDSLTLSRYFNGLRPKQTKGRMFIKFRIHTPNSMNELDKQLGEWAKVNEYGCYKCIIQAERAKTVGWLLYSSQFTDTIHLCKMLESKTGYEWGMKLAQITRTENETLEWKDRTKAMTLYTSDENEDVAIDDVSRIFTVLGESNRYKSLAEKYLFVPPEYTMVDEEAKIDYMEYVHRQSIHMISVRGQFVSYFRGHMDKLYTTRDGTRMTLREMILNIKSTSDKELGGEVTLFHAIDYVSDSSSMWINGSRGPGGAGYIITYYNFLQSEAEVMIKGLGRYIKRMFGTEVAKKAFNIRHFTSTEGWKWDKKKNKFVTPQNTRTKLNLKYDPNRAIAKLQKIKAEKEQEKETTEFILKSNPNMDAIFNTPKTRTERQDTNQAEVVENQGQVAQMQRSDENTTVGSETCKEDTQIAQRREFAQQLTQSDLDSIGEHGELKKRISNISFEDNDKDNESTTSSLTDGTHQQNTKGREKIGKSSSEHSTTSSAILEAMDDASTIQSSMGEESFRKVMNSQFSVAKQKVAITQYLQTQIKKATRVQQRMLAELEKTTKKDQALKTNSNNKARQQESHNKHKEKSQNRKTNRNYKKGQHDNKLKKVTESEDENSSQYSGESMDEDKDNSHTTTATQKEGRTQETIDLTKDKSDNNIIDLSKEATGNSQAGKGK